MNEGKPIVLSSSVMSLVNFSKLIRVWDIN